MEQTPLVHTVSEWMEMDGISNMHWLKDSTGFWETARRTSPLTDSSARPPSLARQLLHGVRCDQATMSNINHRIPLKEPTASKLDDLACDTKS